MLGIFTVVILLICAEASPTNEANELIYGQVGRVLELHLDVVKRIAKDGYYSESHDVTTSDGYILEVNRIPFRRFQNEQNASTTSKPVVFLMHGLQCSSLSYITLGPGRSLAYLLAEDGYDVWMGNARGGLNSRRHVTLDPDVDIDKFFDYSFEDIGMKDLSAMIDYILDVTGRSDLHYIGHSQGGTAFYVLNSMLPQYNKKIKSANLLAGVGYTKHFPNKVLSAIAVYTNPIYAYAVRRRKLEILGPESAEFLYSDCKQSKSEACSLLTILNVVGKMNLKTEILAGASFKEYAHYGQNIKSKTFRRWDYNPITNLVKYGSSQPPQYDLSRVTIDVTMHYALGDDLLDERDVIGMSNDMPNAKIRRIARESFSHMDFIIGPDAKELLYDYILQELRKNK